MRLVDFFSGDPSRYQLVQKVLLFQTAAHIVGRFLVVGPKERVLDICCGPGAMLEVLGQCDYTGVDLNGRHLDYARQKFGRRQVTFAQMDVVTSDFASMGAFDVGLMLGTIHHFNDDQARKILANASKVIGKRLYTLDPVRTKWHPVSNLLCSLDQGRFVRYAESYRLLLSEFFTIDRQAVVASRSGLEMFYITECKPR